MAGVPARPYGTNVLLELDPALHAAVAICGNRVTRRVSAMTPIQVARAPCTTTIALFIAADCKTAAGSKAFFGHAQMEVVIPVYLLVSRPLLFATSPRP